MPSRIKESGRLWAPPCSLLQLFPLAVRHDVGERISGVDDETTHPFAIHRGGVCVVLVLTKEPTCDSQHIH